MPEGDELPNATKEEPHVELTHARVACVVHGEVFRSKWPLGFGPFSVLVFGEAIGRDDVWATMKRLGKAAEPEAESDRVPIGAIEAVLDAKPACCRIDRDTLIKCYKDCGVGVDGRCNVCHRKRLGTPYKTAARDYTHVCFECVSGAFGAH